MLRSLLTRAAEPSTWAGLSGIAVAAGLTEPQWQAVAGLIAAGAAVLAIFLPEKRA